MVLPSRATAVPPTGAARLALGTVQLGLPYGIANQSGQPDLHQARAILDAAVHGGIELYDTAAQYGASEDVLGQCRDLLHDRRLVTKTVACDPTASAQTLKRTVCDGFMASLRNLRRTQVYGLLVHSAPDLLSRAGEGLWQALEELRAQGHVARIGVSVYTPDQARTLAERYPLQLMQLPLNVLDQRFLPLLPWLRQRGIELHTRSTFLQGLLLLDPATTATYFAPIRAQLDALRQLPGSPLDTALRFALQQPVDHVLVGVDSAPQLQNLLQRAAHIAAAPAPTIDGSRFAVNDERYINPSLWPRS